METVTQLILHAIVLALVISFSSASSQAQLVTLKTKLGLVQGRVVTSGDNDTLISVSQFLGLPYGQPPTGNLRFLKPRRHPGWSSQGGPWKALVAPPACPGGPAMSRVDQALTFDEDCLYINVYVTADLKSSVDHVNALQFPVIVFLGATHDALVKRALTESQWRNSALVSVQYRKGVFGFLTLGEYNLTSTSTTTTRLLGNAGLYDQRAALHWIWDNVREFGGDPDRITVVGGDEEDGDVTYHLVSPGSRGLFRSAVLRDSSAASQCCLSKDVSHRMTQQLIVDAKCVLTRPKDLIDNNNNDNDKHAANTHGENIDATTLLSCLQKLDVDDLSQLADYVQNSFSNNWGPVVDGEFLPSSVREALVHRRFNPANLLLGVSRNSVKRQESETFFSSIPSLQNADTNYKFDSKEAISSAITSLLNARFNADNHYSVSSIKKASSICKQAYFNGGECFSNVTAVIDSLAVMYYDVTYALSANLLATQYSNDDHSVFLYEIHHNGVTDADANDVDKYPLEVEQKAWVNFALTG